MTQMKNIFQVIETWGPGGAETVLLHLVKHADRKRYRTRVALLKTGWLSDQLRENDIETVILPSRRSWDVSFLARLIHSIRDFKTDVIHSHLPGANLYSCLAGAFTRRPVITTFHGELFLPGSITRHARMKDLLIRNLASQVVLVADYLRHDFINIARFPVEKLSIIRNAVPIQEPDPSFDGVSKRASLGIEPDEKVVGIVGNFKPPKGYEYFVEAARRIIEVMPKVKFLVVGQGEGKIKRNVEAFIEQHQLQDNIRLLGYRSDVNELVKIIDVFVLSSISEGLPLAAVEAMAASKPVVATRVGGLPELVQDGKNGFLVPAGDAAALAEKILILLRDHDLRQSMGLKAHKIAASAFSIEGMVDSYQQLYERLAK